LQAGETMLVLGAAGGVGIAAIQLGKAMGCDVIAAASSAEKVALAREHGADAGFIYPRGEFDGAKKKQLAQLFKGATEPRGADVIFDAVGGDYCEAAFRSIAWGGRLLVVGFPAGIPAPPLNLALLKGATLVGVFYGAFSEREPDAASRNIEELFRFYEQGKIRPLVSKRFSLEDGGSAIEHLSSRQAQGKVIISVRS
jgi:NADPH2:quinone reductase